MPLECERPQISKDMDAAAAETYAASVPDTVPGDAYAAQLLLIKFTAGISMHK